MKQFGMPDSQRKAMFANMGKNEFSLWNLPSRAWTGLTTPGGALGGGGWLYDPTRTLGMRMADTVQRGVDAVITPSGYLGPQGTLLDTKGTPETGGFIPWFNFGRGAAAPTTTMIGADRYISKANEALLRQKQGEWGEFMKNAQAQSAAYDVVRAEQAKQAAAGRAKMNQALPWWLQSTSPYGGSGIPGGGGPPDEKTAQDAKGLLKFMHDNPGATALAVGLGGLGLGMAMSD